MNVTLMHRDCEVLAFRLDAASGDVSEIRPLEHIELAPVGIRTDEGLSVFALTIFVHRRRIARKRKDLPRILDALKAAHPIELALRARGFSLTDQYWYRLEGDETTWAGSNFYDNEWDPSFARAVLHEDYWALARSDSFVPDVTCGGAARKAWVSNGFGPHMIKAPKHNDAEVYGEVLCSRMLSRMLDEGEYVPYELVNVGGRVYSTCPVIVRPGEDLVTPMAEKCNPADSRWWNSYEDLLARLRVANAGQACAKVAVVDALAFKGDSHSSNYGFIRNTEANVARLGPFFDLAGAFGTFSDNASCAASERNALRALRIAAKHSNLNPKWDYSWFDPSSLDGFADEIEESLSSCEGLSDSYPAIARQLFEMQLAYVTSTAE